MPLGQLDSKRIISLAPPANPLICLLLGLVTCRAPERWAWAVRVKIAGVCFKRNLRAGTALTAVAAPWPPAAGQPRGRARGERAGPRGAAGTLPSPLPSPALAAAAGAGSALGPPAPADADRAHLTPLPAALPLLTGRHE